MNRPRDSRGWLIYEGDWVLRDSRIYERLVCSVSDTQIAHMASSYPHELRFVSPKDYSVLPELSPTRSNYERWFADLGTLEEIEELLNSAGLCDKFFGNCFVCPFDVWDGIKECEGFVPWLKEEAVRL